jgi:hypothetical protein
MPRGPRGERRPADPAAAAVKTVRIATGEIVETVDESETNSYSQPKLKNPAAVTLGRLGGKKGGRARAEKLSKEERREIARRAANARWKDDR